VANSHDLPLDEYLRSGVEIINGNPLGGAAAAALRSGRPEGAGERFVV
jgi:hypothetical protein